jgi:transcriptional regulator
VEAIHDLIRAHSFGILVSRQRETVEASHLPFLLEAARGPLGTLVGHLARANPQWQTLQEGAEAMVIFPGPHAYISPSWYELHPSVPTWNYVAVHAYGIPRLVEEPAAVRQILESLVQTYEGRFDEPWRMELPDSFLEQRIRQIVAFEIEITRLEGKRKLSQNRRQEDRQGAIAGLLRQGDPMSVEVAALMRHTLELDSPGAEPPLVADRSD